MTAQSYRLLSEELREKFGDIYVDTTFQDVTKRVGFLRRSSDKAVLTYHVVHFDPRGIVELGAFHDDIVSGGSLGEVVKSSGIPHVRTDSPLATREVPDVLLDIFGAKGKTCSTKIVTYAVNGQPYARIEEFLNPEFMPPSA